MGIWPALIRICPRQSSVDTLRSTRPGSTSPATSQAVAGWAEGLDSGAAVLPQVGFGLGERRGVDLDAGLGQRGASQVEQPLHLGLEFHTTCIRSD